MGLDQLHLSGGNWLVANCADFPGSTCKVVIMAPENQRADFEEATMQHAITKHSEENTPENRAKLAKAVRTITL